MKSLKLTSIEGTKYFQQDISVVSSHISASAVWRQTGIQSAFTASVPPLPVIACCSFPSERVSCLSASPLSCPLTFSLSHLSPDSPCSGVSLLRQRPRGARERRWALAARLVCGSRKSYAVTFPAFQLEISRRRSLSNEDRDPGGGETGCCSNHFRSRRFLQVDWTNVKNPLWFAHASPKTSASLWKNDRLSLSATFTVLVGADVGFPLIAIIARR